MRPASLAQDRPAPSSCFAEQLASDIAWRNPNTTKFSTQINSPSAPSSTAYCAAHMLRNHFTANICPLALKMHPVWSKHPKPVRTKKGHNNSKTRALHFSRCNIIPVHTRTYMHQRLLSYRPERNTTRNREKEMALLRMPPTCHKQF